MPYGSTDEGALRLLVDPELNLGFTIGYVEEAQENRLLVYDLRRMRPLAPVPLPDPAAPPSTALAVVDASKHRILFPVVSFQLERAGCATGPTDQSAIVVFDIRRLAWSTLDVPCTSNGTDQFSSIALSYDPASNKIYALGEPFAEAALRSFPPDGHNRAAPTLLLRQMDADTMHLDWEIDLRSAGCDGVAFDTATAGTLVRRAGDDVVSYCYGPNLSLFPGGQQGFALRVPLSGDRPIVDRSGLPTIRTTPTLPDPLFPILDPGSGRLFLLTSGLANGNAVWAYDPPNERFFGVIASGLPPSADQYASIYFGLDERTGRTYFLSPAGMLVADARRDPLPAGVSFPLVVRNGADSGPLIAVAPGLRRLFVPVAEKKAWLVYADDIPQPPPDPPEDPDAGTADVPERAGKTGRVFAGVGGAYGAHLINTGGIPRLALNVPPLDTLCQLLRPEDESTALLPAEARDAVGGCVADQVFTSGNRELFLAGAQTELGSESGALAAASAARFSSADTATDTDLKRIDECLERDVARRAGGEAPEGYAAACEAARQPARDAGLDLSGGTRGADGRGFPGRTSECRDFGGTAGTDAHAGGLEELPGSAIGASSTACDAAAPEAVARARAAGLALPDGEAPVFGIGRAWTEVATRLAPEGVVTTATATATGITIGDVSIGRVVSTVTTTARGRTGTTGTSFSRTISDVHGPGIDCAACDPAAVVDGLNRALGLRVRARLPEALELASPRGYQAVAVKDPRQHDSDRTMNDDDTFEVAGLEVIFFNDGKFGRSRLVVQLAGVRAESRYGIFLLPEERGGTRDPGGFAPTLPPVPPGGDLLPPVAGHGPVAAPPPAARGPVERLAEGFRLLVTNPREFGLLFAMWSLLATPVYLGVKRRLRARTIGGW